MSSNRLIQGLPVAVFLLIALIVIMGWFGVRSHQKAIIAYETEFAAHLVANKLEEYINTRFELLEMLRKSWSLHKISDEKTFRTYVALLKNQFSGIHSIDYIDRDGVVRWVGTISEGLSVKNLNLSRNGQIKSLLEKAASTYSVVSGNVRKLSHGMNGFPVYFALRRNGEHAGFIQAVLRIDPLVNSVFSHDLKQHFIFNLTDERAIVYQHGIYDDLKSNQLITRQIHVGDKIWRFEIAINPWHMSPVLSWIEEALLLLGLLFAVLVAFGVKKYFFLKGAFEQSQRRFNGIANLLPEVLIECDAKLKVRYANPMAREVFGFDDETLEHGSDLINLFAKNERFRARKLLASVYNEEQTKTEQFEMQKLSEVFPCEFTIQGIYHDSDDVLIGFRVLIRDVSQWQQAQDDLERLTHYDELTSLPNKSLFEDRLDQAIMKASRSGFNVALLLIDIDRFKLVNDSVGHAGGDLVLKSIGKRLTAFLRQGDTLARIGSDEFALILSNDKEDELTAHGASVVARKILNELLKPFIVEGREVFISGSIGIALYPQDASDSDVLMKSAESAMQHAKTQGKNSYQFFYEDFNQAINERIDIERRLRYALKKHEFDLSFQPIVESQSKQVTAVEALLSWKDPSRGQLLPETFLSHAEENGLIVPIGKWVMRQTIGYYLSWQQEYGFNQRVAINVSIRQLQHEHFLEDLEQILKETNMDPKQLAFEIKEEILFDEKIKGRLILSDLKSLGITIVLDDFGTGLSSMSQLRDTEVEEIKIDQQFTRHIVENQHDQKLVAAIIAFAHQMKMKVIAEGVEDEAQFELLKSFGCDEMQGYYLGAPAPADDFSQTLHQS